VLAAVPPALWNDEGNGNDVMFGLAILCYQLSVITHLGKIRIADQWKTGSCLYLRARTVLHCSQDVG
jgi:hypothetical protein